MWNMSYRLDTSCQHTTSSLAQRAPPPGAEVSLTVKGPHLVSGADALLTVKLTHSGKLDETVVVKVVVDAQMVAVPEGGGRGGEGGEKKNYHCNVGPQTTREHEEEEDIPGKVVPLVHVDAVSFVGHDLIEEGLLLRTTFIQPLGGELEFSQAALVW